MTLVDFSATWCPPCRLIEPILDEIARTRHGDLRVATVDTDQNLHTTVRFNVRSAPTILFFEDGQLVDRIVGAVPKAHIERVIEKHLPGSLTQTRDASGQRAVPVTSSGL